MSNAVEVFKANIGKYFEGPDPRTGGVGAIVGGRDHKHYRDYGNFQVYNYPDKTGIRPGDAVKGDFVGVGEQLDKARSLILFARMTDIDTLRSWVYIDVSGLSGVGFENELDEAQVEAAVQYSNNPIMFTETTIFSGITEIQQAKLDDLRRQRAQSAEMFQSEIDAIQRAEHEAAAGARYYYLR